MKILCGKNTDKRTDANIYGHVIDKKTGEHMPFVTIQLKGTTIATTTDKTGHYFLKNLPEGTHHCGEIPGGIKQWRKP